MQHASFLFFSRKKKSFRRHDEVFFFCCFCGSRVKTRQSYTSRPSSRSHSPIRKREVCTLLRFSLASHKVPIAREREKNLSPFRRVTSQSLSLSLCPDDEFTFTLRIHTRKLFTFVRYTYIDGNSQIDRPSTTTLFARSWANYLVAI